MITYTCNYCVLCGIIVDSTYSKIIGDLTEGGLLSKDFRILCCFCHNAIYNPSAVKDIKLSDTNPVYFIIYINNHTSRWIKYSDVTRGVRYKFPIFLKFFQSYVSNFGGKVNDRDKE